MNNLDTKIKILCCYYIDNIFVPSNDIYYPIQCGKNSNDIDLGIIGDNTGDNISDRNRYYSEITGLYWAWKNLKNIEYIGLCSYRRFFNYKRHAFSVVKTLNIKDVKQIDEIEIPNLHKILASYDVIIPRPYIYPYSIRNVCRMNYRNEDFEILQSVIHELSPEYDMTFRNYYYMNNKMIGHNMFIWSWDNFDKYCNWVFPILFEVEKRINPVNYPKNQVRVFGYMHEILLGIFIEKNKLKKYYSQIDWVTDDSLNFRFNSMLYKIASELSFFFNKPRNLKK